MERAGNLIHKLRELYDQKADPQQLLITVQLLQKELAQYTNGHARSLGTKKVAVTFPNNLQTSIFSDQLAVPKEVYVLDSTPEYPEDPEEKEDAFPTLPEITKPELVKPVYETIAVPISTPPPVAVFEAPSPVYEIPEVKELNETMVNETESLNDRLKHGKAELGDVLTDAPIKDLRKGIGINDRFLFISELFRGDEAMYERSIKTINGFSILPEAEYWIQRELKVKLGWSDANQTVQQFGQLVKRRFS
jgi:hypothetical protein